MLNKTVKENMSTRPITIGWNEKMELAYKRMHANRVRHLPVTNEAGEVVGMLSDRDVQRSMISRIEHPYGAISDETIEFDEEARVRDYMSWPAKCVEQNADLRVVAQRMVSEKVSSLLVVNSTETVGIVTAEDLLNVLADILSDPQGSEHWTLDRLLEGAFTQLRSTVV